MALQRFNPAFLLPVRSVSPLDVVARIKPGTRIAMITGLADTVAPPELAETYANALRRRGINVSLTILPGQGHEIFDDRRVIAAAVALASPP